VKRIQETVVSAIRVNLALLLGLLSMFGGNAFAGVFSFTGLSLVTTVEELKHRYPNSSMVGNHLYVAEADSHDHIYGIEIPGPNPGGRLRLSFERSRKLSHDAQPQYPTCEKILSILETRYGAPSRVKEFAEERSWNRRLSWEKDRELLSLHCFRMRGTDFFAEAITIAKSSP